MLSHYSNDYMKAPVLRNTYIDCIVTNDSDCVYCEVQTLSLDRTPVNFKQFISFYLLLFPGVYTDTQWVDNIGMDLQEVGCGYMDWIGLAQDRDRWRTLMNAVMNLLLP